MYYTRHGENGMDMICTQYASDLFVRPRGVELEQVEGDVVVELVEDGVQGCQSGVLVHSYFTCVRMDIQVYSRGIMIWCFFTTAA